MVRGVQIYTIVLQSLVPSFLNTHVWKFVVCLLRSCLVVSGVFKLTKSLNMQNTGTPAVGLDTPGVTCPPKIKKRWKKLHKAFQTYLISLCVPHR